MECTYIVAERLLWRTACVRDQKNLTVLQFSGREGCLKTVVDSLPRDAPSQIIRVMESQLVSTFSFHVHSSVDYEQMVEWVSVLRICFCQHSDTALSTLVETDDGCVFSGGGAYAELIECVSRTGDQGIAGPGRELNVIGKRNKVIVQRCDFGSSQGEKQKLCSVFGHCFSP